ncbi:HWE histidine kinase domain-containing protein [Rhodoplanes sp. TEM]|uniref:Blue-light-activated histidine kinase n=1 Tax=Rhodoplanes tepidamans TaxID=200616 RepID=A0ABT5J9I9_RHOTP|nr:MULTISPECIES: HWE histidine kinase domain-containing protein [Rhodoplanes]MDC7786315.1 HWE histidine kinase domain-containing protein [Rhodoplanes tepidamans]MDC7984726.1 HWE histidine kinase domain-containing protein [Rhodoplanes sp. TEM]MDQ0354058.1 two-component sensor histidine kinase/DNA-binding response OmpR family regulator [Rhodoplanes tepidamans]
MRETDRRDTDRHEPVDILLVDDQPAKLMSYEVILRELGERLITATSARDALRHLLRTDVAVVLVDVCMPELDGFELARMIRDHPRFEQTAIIFISAVHLSDEDRVRGYEMGAVDYVPVPVIPEVLRAKVRVFVDLFRKTRQLEALARDLEQRVAERTAALEASTERLRESERRRSVALAAGQMGAWDWDVRTGDCVWDPGQYRIFGVDPDSFRPTFEVIRPMIVAEDLERIRGILRSEGERQTFQVEARIVRPDGEQRWCICAAAVTPDERGRPARVSGVTIDITDRKLAEERQLLLAREVDHRARNALAIVQAIVRLTTARDPQAYMAAVEGRIRALAQAHTLLSESRWQGADVRRLVDEELEAYRRGGPRVATDGPTVSLPPDRAQVLALALHELATNSVKYGALSVETGALDVAWRFDGERVILRWTETGGPPVRKPESRGFGTKILEASINQQIAGRVTLDWRPTGLACTLEIPCGARPKSALPPDDAAHAQDVDAGEAPAAPQATRIPARKTATAHGA